MNRWLTVICVSLLPISGWASGGSLQWVTPDFFIQTLDTKITQERRLGDEDCRAQISKAMCLVDPVEWGDFKEPRPCLEGGIAYSKPFEELYDHLPRPVQKMFCSLKVIYVEKSLVPTAYAGLKRDSAGQVIGSMMGIRKSLLDNPVPLEQWATWKEQLSFGGVKDSFTLTPDLPWICSKTDQPVNDLLFMIVTHEFGHMFDFANDINKTTTCVSEPNNHDSVVCEMDPKSFGGLSWKTNFSPLPENDFQNRQGLCFYRCEAGFIGRSAINNLYQDFYEKTNFISLYAATNPYDDFAESLAYRLMDNQLSARYVIDTKQGKTLDIMQKLKSDRFRNKSEYIENFFHREHIIYP